MCGVSNRFEAAAAYKQNYPNVTTVCEGWAFHG